MQDEAKRFGEEHGNSAESQWTPQGAIDACDRAGVDFAIASISTPGVWYGDVALGRKLARQWNEAAAQTVREHPTRFGFFAPVPLPDTDGSLAEIEYAYSTLHADGINLLSNFGGKWLGDPAFTPVMEELDRRHAVAYVHPTRTKITNLVPDLIDAILEYGTETSRTIASLMFSGTATRFPNIRFIFSHGGGTLPFLMGRILFWAERRQDLRPRLPDGPVAQVRKFFFDTAQAYNPYALASMTRLMPASQIVFGTDFPVITPAVTAQGLIDFGFSEAELRLIDRDNALRLMPRLNW
jgi:predicted TIM-barrel fold metal-dependent hydrolase